MKVHDDIETLADVYLAGGLEAGERRGVDEHAASCDACAAVLRDASEFHGWMKGSSSAGAPPAGLEDRIIANLRAASPSARRWPRTPRFIRMLGGVAAVFALIVLGGLFSRTDEALSLVQRNLSAHSGIEPYDEKAGHDVKFQRLEQYMDGYIGDSTADKEVMSGWGRKEREDWVEGRFAGGARAGESRGRMSERESLKSAADAKPAAPPAAPAPMEEGEADRAEAADKAANSLGKLVDEAPTKRIPFVDDRKIIRNADLHLEVESYDSAYAKIGEIAKAKKGFVAGASTTRLANGKIRATVTLRIPPETFEDALKDLRALGIVRHQAIGTQDVTKQYQDLESRLKSKETLVERLKKVLLEGKGTVKELMEVEVQMGATIEQIEVIKGELKYFDNLVGLSTITMQIFEKDLGLPFEYVLTLQSVIAVTDPDADAVYAKAQQAILDAGGQVAESRMNRANDDSASGFVRGKVDAEKFPAVRAALKALAKHVDQDTVNQQQTGRGGQGDAKPGAHVRKEQAVIDFTVNTPPLVVTRRASIVVEAAPAETAYQTARREVEAAGGKILGGSLTDRTGGASAFVRAQVKAEKFPDLVEKFKTLGKVKNATVKQDEPGAETGRPPLLREQGEIVLEIASPPPLLSEETGLVKVLRETFSGSVAGILWSIEKLVVGIALAGPWIVLAVLVIVVWRRARRRANVQGA